MSSMILVARRRARGIFERRQQPDLAEKTYHRKYSSVMCSCSHCQCVTGTPKHQQCRVCRIDNIASLLIASFVDGAVSFTVQARRVWFIQKLSMVSLQFCNLLKDQYRNRTFIEQRIAELELDPPKNVCLNTGSASVSL